jgi:hypothetical protein
MDKIVVAISKDGVLGDSFTMDLTDDSHVVMLHSEAGKPQYFCVGENEQLVFNAAEHTVREFYGRPYAAMTTMNELQKFGSSKRIRTYLQRVGEYLQKGVNEALRITERNLTPDERKRGEEYAQTKMGEASGETSI